MSELAGSGGLADFVARREAARGRRSQVETLFATCEHRVFARTNRLFFWFLLAQWAFTSGFALWVAAEGASPGLAAGVVCAGGVLALPAVGLIRWLPHAFVTRCTVALAQIGFGVLLVQLSGGRLEAHYHAFGSLAFLSLYRDWRVLPLAAAAVVGHHAVLGIWWPGLLAPGGGPTVWGFVGHAGWLALESAALAWSCLYSRREMREICQRQDAHQHLLEELEQRVRDRTSDLEAEMRARASTAEKLQQNEQHHRALVATVPIGIFETSRSGAVRFANPFLLGLIGLPPTFDAKVLSLDDGRLFPIRERERLWHRLENEQEVRGFAATFRRFDGSEFEVLINARLKRTGPGDELVCEGTLEDVTVRKRAERELHALHSQLVLASRQAGMAEVATGVLHNVGNVLTSVNLIVHDVQDRLKTTRLSHLRRVVEVMQRERARLGEFFTADPAGRQLPEFLAKLDEHLAAENRELLTDVEGLVRHFDHIREIIVTQQGGAQLFGVTETLGPAQLFEDALRLNAESFERHGITLEQEFADARPVQADRHKVLQILVNLLKNAKDALQGVKPGERVIRVRVAPAGAVAVALSVADNGPGIPAANLKRIFQHGFTTKPSGHGFGLHSSVLAAREMGGDLVAVSDGPGRGATFTLTLPLARSPES